MRLPIRNYLSVPMTLVLEPMCDEFEISPGGEAIVTLEDGRPHSIDLHPGNRVLLWDEGADPEATIEIYPDQQIGRL